MKIYLFIYNIYPKITLFVLPAPLPPLRFWYFSRRKVHIQKLEQPRTAPNVSKIQAIYRVQRVFTHKWITQL